MEATFLLNRGDFEQKFYRMDAPFVLSALKQPSPTRRTVSKKERTEWHKVVFFRKHAEIVREYLSKGSSTTWGDLNVEKWEDRDGNKKQITKVIGSKLIVLDEKGSL